MKSDLAQRLVRGAMVVLLAVLAGLAVIPVASAQEGDPAEAEVAIFGALDDAEHGLVEGVELEALLGEEVVGTATSDENGEFRIVVPGPGTYRVRLDPTTLPEGVSLRDPERTELEAVRVLEGRDKRVVFALGERARPRPDDVARPPSGNRVVNRLWTGLVVGIVIALSSIGLSLVFGTTRLVNFAHGEMVTLGALLGWFFSSGTVGPGWSLFIAGAIAVALSGLFGAVQDRLLWRPLLDRRTDLISLMIVSIGLAMLLRYTFTVFFGSNVRPFREYAAQAPWVWGPLVLRPKQLVVLAIGVVVIALYALVLQKTRLGTAIRATSDNRDLAESSGINVTRVVLIVWVAGSALAALGGLSFATLYGVEWDIGFRLLLPIFAAVVLGGLGTAYGPLVGGLAIGLVSELSTLWVPAEFKFAWALFGLIILLLIRPQGLLGRPERVG
ncbi:MAG TPA: branched-chain amino acid ABC transporter permease [Acidimicrobiales bacterium]|nr:branched-chain amino acid ABC transporter permease [Acidimicrobiales bacterium]